MTRPRLDDVARALGVKLEQVSQLRHRGMPTCSIAKARIWFDRHGMNYTERRTHATPRGQTGR